MLKPVNGTWFEFRHHNAAEGKYWNEICKNFTSEQWSEKIGEIASLGMKYIVLMATGYKNDTEEECYFETDIFPQAQLKCDDPMEVLMETCDEKGINVFVSCGFYGHWLKAKENIESDEVKSRAFRAMAQLHEKYGHHKSFYGWYYPDEICINGHFDENFISFVNEYSAYARKIAPGTKTLIAPYGTNRAAADDLFVSQLERMDVDFIAYQDEVGVQKSSVDDTGEYYKALRRAHDAAGRAKIWADIEFFDFEGRVYESALIPAKSERVIKQLDAVSPYVDEILCYQYQGMMNKPNTNSYCGYEGSEELYRAICKYNKKCLEA